jgi:hypothetical protein
MNTALKRAALLVAATACGIWTSGASAASCVVDEQGSKERLYVATPPGGGACYDYGKPNMQGTAIGSVVFGNKILELPSGYTDRTSLLSVNQNTGEFSVSGVNPSVPWILVLKQGSSWAAFRLPSGVFQGNYSSCTWKNGACDKPPTYELSHSELFGSSQTSAVPIPAAAWLLGSGLIGLVAVGRRRRNGVPTAA